MEQLHAHDYHQNVTSKHSTISGHRIWYKMYAQHRNCGSDLLKQSSRHVTHSGLAHHVLCRIYTAGVKGLCILILTKRLDSDTHDIWTDEELQPSSLTCTGRHCCRHWRGRSTV